MRVVATVACTSATRDVKLKPTLAQDPLKQQYKLSCTDPVSVERVGPFRAWDPEAACWPISLQQRGILKDVCQRTDATWLRTVLLPFIDSSDNRSEPSLRMLDWFVTNFSKSNGTVINGIHIHSDYENTRRAYQCRHFDPFRRNLKLSFDVNDMTEYTTVGQINFVFWAHSMGVLEYVRQNKDAIDADMCGVCRKRRQQRREQTETGQRRKRVALSRGKRMSCRIHRWSRLISLEGKSVRG